MKPLANKLINRKRIKDSNEFLLKNYFIYLYVLQELVKLITVKARYSEPRYSEQ